MRKTEIDDEQSGLTPAVSERDHFEGPAGAPLTLVEYGDYQCPYCGAAYPEIKKVQKKLGKKLRFVFRNFPLVESHPYALIAAEAAEAAALQGKFWEMHDLIYEEQESLEPGVIASWAERLGLDMAKFGAVLRQGALQKRIAEDRKSGIMSGVNGTPTFFINGRRHDGPPDAESLLAALSAAA